MPRGLGLLAGEAVREPASEPASFNGVDSADSRPAQGVAPGLLQALPAERDLWLPGPRGSGGEAACRLRRRRY